MKKSGVTLSDPIDLPKGDERLSVKSLISKHQEKIESLRNELTGEDSFDPLKHDDLWLLRFLLSHKMKHKASLKAAKHTLSFRAKYELDKKDIRYFPIGPGCTNSSEGMKAFMKYCPPDTFCFTLPDAQRGVVAFLTFGNIDDKVLVEKVSEEHWLDCFVYAAEWSFQWLDYVTRKTGRLTKSIRIVDLSDTPFSVNREKHRRDGQAMNLMEDCYPQMLQTIFVANPPSWVQMAWRIVRLVLPKRVVQKIDFVSPKSSQREKRRILQWIDEENLPEKFGGKYKQWPPMFELPTD